MALNMFNAMGAAKKIEAAVEAGAADIKKDGAPVLAFVEKLGSVIPTLAVALQAAFSAAVAAGKLTQAQVDEFNALEKEAEALAPQIAQLEKDAAAAIATVQAVIK